jgi:hypothetical protein
MRMREAFSPDRPGGGEMPIPNRLARHVAAILANKKLVPLSPLVTTLDAMRCRARDLLSNYQPAISSGSRLFHGTAH